MSNEPINEQKKLNTPNKFSNILVWRQSLSCLFLKIQTVKLYETNMLTNAQYGLETQSHFAEGTYM